MTERAYKTSERQRRNAANQRKRAAADPEERARVRERQRKWRQDNKARLAEKDREYQRKNSTKIRLQRKGVCLSHAAVVEAHTGTCDICGGAPDGRWKTLAIDHCHATNAFRGLLCSNCNRGLGMFKDNPDLLMKAINYLRQHSDKYRVELAAATQNPREK